MATSEHHDERRPKLPGAADRAKGFKISTTMPDELLRHNISDEELGALGDMRRDYLWEGMWVALGVWLTALIPALSTVLTYYSDEVEEKIPLGDLVQVNVFWVSVSVFAVLCYMMKNKSKGAKDLVKEIRARTKQEHV